MYLASLGIWREHEGDRGREIERIGRMLEINTIHLGDSYKLIKDIPDKSVDLVIIDPPYEIVGGGCMTGIFKDRGTRHFNAIEDKNLTTGFDDSILIELERVMKRTNIYIWCNKNQIHQLLNFFRQWK